MVSLKLKNFRKFFVEFLVLNLENEVGERCKYIFFLFGKEYV